MNAAESSLHLFYYDLLAFDIFAPKPCTGVPADLMRDKEATSCGAPLTLVSMLPNHSIYHPEQRTRCHPLPALRTLGKSVAHNRLSEGWVSIDSTLNVGAWLPLRSCITLCLAVSNFCMVLSITPLPCDACVPM